MVTPETNLGAQCDCASVGPAQELIHHHSKLNHDLIVRHGLCKNDVLVLSAPQRHASCHDKVDTALLALARYLEGCCVISSIPTCSALPGQPKGISELQTARVRSVLLALEASCSSFIKRCPIETRYTLDCSHLGLLPFGHGPHLLPWSWSIRWYDTQELSFLFLAQRQPLWLGGKPLFRYARPLAYAL
jgi:hypothetical protein